MKNKTNEPTGEHRPMAIESDVDILLQWYPWFSRDQIKEALLLSKNNRTKVMSYLHLKSGAWTHDDHAEW
jgi:hypothetical protein